MSLFLTFLSALVATFFPSGEREPVWPEGKMPHASSAQIAAMTYETASADFQADDFRTPYLEWFDAPARPNGTCMILISGGSYKNCCDQKLIEKWRKAFTEKGIQCVNFVYRTPRPEGIPYWQTAWEDGQRAVRVVRSQAARRGFDPEKIGVCGMSAGGHLTLLLATSSLTPAYAPVDELDAVPCHINLAVVNAPAYVTSDADSLGIPAPRNGYGPDITVSRVFHFDENTCSMSLHHGGADIYSPDGSALVYKKLYQMGVPAELHLYPNKGHGAHGFPQAIDFLAKMGYLQADEPAPLSAVVSGDPVEAVDAWEADRAAGIQRELHVIINQ